MMWPTIVNTQIVNKDGTPSMQFLMVLEQLIGGLNQSFSDGGIALPNAGAQTVSDLPKTGNGTMLYDASSHEPKININGVVKTIQTV